MQKSADSSKGDLTVGGANASASTSSTVSSNSVASTLQDAPLSDAAFVRDLLWNEFPECCGCPVVGAEYMGQQEQVCCGNPEPAMLNDAQIVATLRARFPNGDPDVLAPTEREKFEEWYLRDHFDAKTSAASLAWSAWQAARAGRAPIEEHQRVELLSVLRDIEMETRDGGQWTSAEINEVARAAIAAGNRRATPIKE